MLKRLAVVFVLLAGPAFAAETPRIDFTTSVAIDGQLVVDDFKCPIPLDGSGKPTSAPRPCQTPYTVGALAFYALERSDPRQTWADGVKRDDLARAIRTAKDFPLLPDQRDLIEAAMGPLWSPPILGFVKRVIEPTPAALPEK